MYRAKQSGSDRIEIFEPGMRRDRDSHVEVEGDLRKAIEKGQVKVLYQPIVYLPTKELAGFEAIVRWEHPKHGLVNPLSLVTMADQSELLIKLEVLCHGSCRKGCGALADRVAARRTAALRHYQHFGPATFPARGGSGNPARPGPQHRAARHAAARNRRSLVMENPEQAAEVLKVLRGSGVELALDDFGTGYSSLAYLNRFPFDTIKINRELVRGSGTASGAAIMRSMVALAHELSKTVVAEGVERADEATFLRSIGCEYAQGYHFGEPIPERAVIAASEDGAPFGAQNAAARLLPSEARGRKRPRRTCSAKHRRERRAGERSCQHANVTQPCRSGLSCASDRRPSNDKGSRKRRLQRPDCAVLPMRTKKRRCAAARARSRTGSPLPLASDAHADAASPSNVAAKYLRRSRQAGITARLAAADMVTCAAAVTCRSRDPNQRSTGLQTEHH